MLKKIAASADGEALPTANFNRRLALMGGLSAAGAAIVGGPTAVLASPGHQLPATPLLPRADLLQAYNEWLYYERRLLIREIYHDEHPDWQMMERYVPCNTIASHYHFPLLKTAGSQTWETMPTPAKRALLVLQAVGVDFGLQRDRT
ncbi:hypothetical protein X747_24690 [Mesorhizobium sp. LNJC384A00]|uniref:hypothetical protein n=1 Tax=Mesorhizobium sp. LNJC384A00 TaxID=1287268 RepID=UPI0003CEE78D|nr:hypothetical protein [Mesorhizobium sp. LNJC384A00]ESY37873.1 hypothetical protein X747_24690 [Mesorhizobium sp. LNJC384A00]